MNYNYMIFYKYRFSEEEEWYYKNTIIVLKKPVSQHELKSLLIKDIDNCWRTNPYYESVFISMTIVSDDIADAW